MSQKEKKDFDQEAASWDESPVRVQLANEVADAIIAAARPTSEMEVLDFGCGTGLVTMRLQPLVKTIMGADSSQGMLAVLAHKAEKQQLANVRTRLVDMDHWEALPDSFDLIVSSMTLHHIPEPMALIRQLYDRLLPGGSLCIADLDQEDGSFHPDNIGVFHFGFDRPALKQLFETAGFTGVNDVTATRIRRPDKGDREYPVFLVVGRRPG